MVCAEGTDWRDFSRRTMTISTSASSVERWIASWAFLFGALEKALDLIEIDRIQAQILATDQTRHERWMRATRGATWAHYYRWPAPAHLAYAMFWIGRRTDGVVQFVDPRRLLQMFRAIYDEKPIPEGDWEADLRHAPHMMALARSVHYQLLAIMTCGSSMSDLVSAVAQGDKHDEAFRLAVRIDPASFTCAPLARRWQHAIVSYDADFLKNLRNDLGNPEPLVDRETVRLRAALALLARVRQLDRLNQELAYELFYIRTKIYRPKRTRKDPSGSLWKFIQRWKKEQETKIPGNLSSA